MQKIYKYNLDIVDSQLVEMPYGAQILSVQQQQSELVMWAIVNTEQETVKREILIVGTGNPSNNHLWIMDYIGIVQLDGLVWHVFDKGYI